MKFILLGFWVFPYTPKNRPTLFPLIQTLYNPHNYCKIKTYGGLAQLVEQRTLNFTGLIELSP